MATLIDCCNRALAQIAAGSIASLDDGTIEARECARFIPALISEIATWYEWGWAIVTVTLAEVPNDRAAEWNHAYALPSDMAQVLSVRGPGCDAGPQSWKPTRGNFPFPEQDASPIRFLIEGNTLYTNQDRAALRYIHAASDVGAYPPMLARAFELEVAARIALPLRKDTKLAQSLSQQAAQAKQQAIADDMNQHPKPPAIYTSDAAYARFGLSDFG